MLRKVDANKKTPLSYILVSGFWHGANWTLLFGIFECALPLPLMLTNKKIV
jgi:D-alanyl-lipoteichoic acid acyltransferase DltB (MBOAT superfamily)